MSRSKRPAAETPVVRQAVRRFCIWSGVAMVVIAVAATLVSEHIAREEAIRDARSRGAGMANAIAAPLVDSDVRAGEPEAVAKLAAALSARVRSGAVRHVKVWSAEGRVLWSDQEGLVGRRFDLPADVEALFGTTDDVTEISEVDPADAARDEGPLLEVYVGTRDAEGVPMVFQAYVPPERLDEDRIAVLTELIPLALSILLVVQITMLPLAVSLARRVERGQAERAEILRRALMASDLERRRIAQDLHDGVIQDLAGLSYALPTVVATLPPGAAGERARRTARQMAAILHDDVASLRTLLTDIYPPDLEGAGLATALDDLATGAAQADIAVRVDLPDGLEVPTDAARLVYRVAREGLRNVVRHAHAGAAQVSVRRRGEDLLVRVADDGRGLGDAGGQPGHLGVRLLADTVADLGGRLVLRDGEPGGAVLEVTFPSSMTA